MVDDIEKAIIQRLKSYVTDLPVEAFPDRPTEFKKLPFQKGIVLVGFRSGRYSRPTNLDSIIQERVLEFAVTVQMRDLRGHDGAYGVLELIRQGLTGFCPLGDDRPLYPTEEVFLDQTENLWIYGMTFEMKQRQAA